MNIFGDKNLSPQYYGILSMLNAYACTDEIAGRARNDELMARNDESLTYMVKNSGRA